MEPKLVVGQARVYDDVLPEDLFLNVFEMMCALPYARTDAQQWLKVWTLADGAILRSNQWTASAPQWNLVEAGNPNGNNRAPKVLVEVLGHLRKVLALHPDLPEIKRILMIPYVWPPKSSISWHQDGTAKDTQRVGAFTLYTHKHWNAEWGGEFMLAEIESELKQNPFDNSEVSEEVISHGHGVWVSPKPNRIIINPSNLYHKVAKTTEAASPRLSIQGFLYA